MIRIPSRPVIISTALALMFILSVCNIIIESEFSGAYGSGSCGTNATWTLDGAGHLIISGTGAINDFNGYMTGDPPWGTEITTVVIHEGITYLGSNSFRYCASLISVTLPSTLQNIGVSAFERCTALSSITIPNNVKNIGANAFYQCWSLSEINLGTGLEQIFSDVFKETQITTINLPASLQNYAQFSLSFGSLRNINVDENNPYFSSRDGVLLNKAGDKLLVYPIGRDNASYSVPVYVKTIGVWAFKGSIHLQSITLPYSTTTIEPSAFIDCTALTSVTSYGLRSIGGSAFSGCTSLTSVDFIQGVSALPDNVFGDCPVETLVIPSSVSSIKTPFYNPANNTAGNLLDSTVTTICIPSTVTHYDQSEAGPYLYVSSMNGWKFYEADQTTEINKDADHLSGYVYQKFDVGKYKRVHTCQILEPQAPTCDGAGLSIGVYCPDSSETLIAQSPIPALGGEHGDQKAIVSNIATAGNTCTYDVNNVCVKCGHVSSSEHKTVTADSNIVAAGFYNDTIIWVKDSQGRLILDGSGPMISPINAQNTYSPWGKDITSAVVGQGITTVGQRAFADSSLRSVSLPNTVVSIEMMAFNGCHNLTSVSFPSSLKVIGDYSFGGSGLIQITISDDITYIGKDAFSNVDSLTEVSIPDSVTQLGNYAFEGNDTLRKAYIGSGITSMMGTFYNCPNLRYVIFSENSHITTIGSQSFSFAGLRSINIPASVTAFGDQAIAVNDINAIYDENGALLDVTPANLAGHLIHWDGTKLVRTDSHDFENVDTDVVVYCTETGHCNRTPTCTLCGFEEATYYVELAPVGHDMQDVPAREPTKRDIGWEAYTACSRCDHTEGYAEIPALGYTVDFVDLDGTTMIDHREHVQYGTVIIPPLTIPTLEEDSVFTYEFDKWGGHYEGMTVTDDVTFLPVFIEYLKVTNPEPGKIAISTEGEYAAFKSETMGLIIDTAKESNEVTLDIKIKDITVAFDNASLKNLNAENARLTIEEVDKGTLDEKTRGIVGDGLLLDISFGENKDFGEGTVSFTIPYTVKEGQDPEGVKVYYIQDGEIKEKFDCVIVDGKLTFSTSHLSNYAIVYEEPVEEFPMMYVIAGAIGALVLIGGIGAVIVIKRKH